MEGHDIKDPYLDHNRCVGRLLDTYKKHGNLIVGFDFDDTIFNYHLDKNFTYPVVISLLRECSDRGMTMVLFAVRSSEVELNEALRECRRLGIGVDHVNKSPLFPHSRKPFLNIYLDDKAGLESACLHLRSFLDIRFK